MLGSRRFLINAFKNSRENLLILCHLLGPVYSQLHQSIRLCRQVFADDCQLGLVVVAKVGAFGLLVVNRVCVNLGPLFGVDPGHSGQLEVLLKFLALPALNSWLVPHPADDLGLDEILDAFFVQ